MKLRIVALGHRMPAWVNAAFEDYARRMRGEFALQILAEHTRRDDDGQGRERAVGFLVRRDFICERGFQRGLERAEAKFARFGHC